MLSDGIRKKGRTMSFRDNLQHLRATRNMTQEQLAMLVGVSRQSVTKWEAERSYPEMDKLLKICQIFDCSLDDLVQGDLTARAPEPEMTVPTAALSEDVVGYDEHHRSFALRIAVGVSSCIMAIAAAAALSDFVGDAPAALGLFLFVGIGLALIIPAGIEHEAFQRAHPYVANFYNDEQRSAEKRSFGYRLAAGICIILLALAAASFADAQGAETMSGVLMLVGASVGTGLIVYSGMMDSRLDVESYNIEALEELSEEEIASIVGEERAPRVLEKVRRSKRKGAVCGIIMLLATVVALPLLFWGTQTEHTFWMRFFWIPWMVGGLFCAIASIVIDQRG